MKHSQTIHWSTRLLSICCLIALMSVSDQAMAKLSVTKPKITSTPYSGLGKKDKWELACEGYYTYITIDEHGDTQVYVNDEGGGYSKDEKYRVELPDDMEWSRVSIIGGKSTDAKWNAFADPYDPNYNNPADVCQSVHIKMDGGLVSDIVLAKALSGTKNFVRGNAEFIMTGGTVYSITSSDYIFGNITISLSNIRYSGNGPIFLGREEETWKRTTLFINNNCSFYIPSSRLLLEEVEDCKGAVIPDPDRSNVVHAFNAAVIPAGHTLVCDTLYHNAGITFNGYVDVRKCSGLIYNGMSSQPEFSSNQLSVKPHQHIQNMVKRATCTTDATFNTFCDVCGTTLQPIVDPDEHLAKGHVWVQDEAVDATCLSAGHTAGSHCSRCGIVGTRMISKSALGHNFQVGKSMPGFSACFGGNIVVKMCTRCNYFETDSNPIKNHNWVQVLTRNKPSNLNLPTVINNTIWENLYRLSRVSTCTETGMRYSVCKDCGFILSEITDALGHNTVNVAKVAATCDTPGTGAYTYCTRCDYKYYNQLVIKEEGRKDVIVRQKVEFADLADIHISPLGHKYGVEASYVKSPETHVCDATCEDDELYYQTCANAGCGHINTEYTFTGEKAFGHHYDIKSIDFVSNNNPESGILTMGCDRCSKTWPNFQFSVSDVIGEFKMAEEEEDDDDDYFYEDDEDDDDEEDEDDDSAIDPDHIWDPKDVTKFQGYCVHSTLESVDVLPTCVRGHGTYRINFYYEGQAMTTTYENFVRPNGYTHNYDSDGVCHEQHYKIKEIPNPHFEGEIYKNRAGDIIYEYDEDGNLIPDNTVYRAQAAIVVPTRDYYYNSEAIIAWKRYNYITGDYLTHPEWRGSSIPVLDENLPTAIADSIKNWGKAIVTLYGDLDVNSLFDLQQDGLTVVHNGHVVEPIFNDGTAYKRKEPISMSNFTYSRNFDSNVFAAYFVPFALSYNDWKDQADIYELVSISQNAQVTTLGIRRLGEGSRAIAGTPYIIKPKEAGTMLINAHDVTLLSNTIRDFPTILQGDTYSYIFTGTKDYVDIKTDTYMFMSTTGGLQYYGGPYQPRLKPQRWYMTIRDKANNLNIRPSQMFGSAARILVLDDDDTTGIEQIETNDFLVPIHEAIIYDLQGRRLDAPRHGINIVNGKKVVM